jgi:hypothetical protein
MLDVSIVTRRKSDKKGRRANMKKIFKTAPFNIYEGGKKISTAVFWCVVASLGSHLVYNSLEA